MRKPEKVRFELRTNQNLSRQNLQRAYESLSVEEPEIVNDIPVIGAFIRGLKHIVRKCIRWYVMPAGENRRIIIRLSPIWRKTMTGCIRF